MALITLHDTRRAVMLPLHVHRAKKLPTWSGVTDVMPRFVEVRFWGHCETLLLASYYLCLSVCPSLSVCVCPSIHPTVRMEQLGSRWTDFHES